MKTLPGISTGLLIVMLLFGPFALAEKPLIKALEGAIESRSISIVLNSDKQRGTVTAVSDAASGVRPTLLPLNAETRIYINEVLTPLQQLPVIIDRPGVVLYALEGDRVATRVMVSD